MDFDAVADELFGMPPAAFIERRNALATAARGDNGVALAAKIKALHRPTSGAALINALVRERGEVVASFLTLGAELRDAQSRGDGEQMRALAGRRQQLMRELDRHVADLAKDRGLTATRAVEQDVHATMLAALSDRRAEAIVRGGRLESALNDATFGDSAPAADARPNSERQPESDPVGSSSARRLASAERKLEEANASAAAAADAVEQLAAEVSRAQAELTDLENQLEETLKRARNLERDKTTADRKVATARDAHTDAARRAKALRETATKAQLAYEHENTN